VTLDLSGRPGLRRGVRLVHDPVRDRMALLYPEGVLLLNETAAAVLAYCDGRRTVPAVAEALSEEYEGVSAEDVLDLLADFDARRLLASDGTGRPAQAVETKEGGGLQARPLLLVRPHDDLHPNGG